MIRCKTTHWNWNHEVIVLSFSLLYNQGLIALVTVLYYKYMYLKYPSDSQCGRQPAPQRPDPLVARDLHKSILRKTNTTPCLSLGTVEFQKKYNHLGLQKDRSFPIQCFNYVKPGDVVLCWWEWIRGFWVSYQGATEVGWCFVPAGAAGPILTHIDMIHQAITIQEALPWETKHKNRVTKTTILVNTLLYETWCSTYIYTIDR